MKRCLVSGGLLLVLVTGAGQASSHYQPLPQANAGVNTDVVVDMPREAWTQAERRQPDCLRCCLFESRNYSEGAVVKSEGVLLQCVRDAQALGTNNLIWKIVK